MIELEVYAAGVRNLEKILELDHEWEAITGLRYKVDSNHDIVYLELDSPVLMVDEIHAVFTKLGLESRIVGPVPPELNQKSKTQLLPSRSEHGEQEEENERAENGEGAGENERLDQTDFLEPADRLDQPEETGYTDHIDQTQPGEY